MLRPPEPLGRSGRLKVWGDGVAETEGEDGRVELVVVRLLEREPKREN